MRRANVTEKRATTEAPHVPPLRTPRYMFGQVLKRGDFTGRIDTIFADYWAALDGFCVPPGWFEEQEEPPETKDQVFYGLIAMDGEGAILAGERDVEVTYPDGYNPCDTCGCRHLPKANTFCPR